MSEATDSYRCTVLPPRPGTRTQTAHLLHPMLQAWAATAGRTLYPGTLNVCADRDVELPPQHIALRPWDGYLPPLKLKSMPGYDPRLYPGRVGGIDVWLYRWCSDESLANFVSAEACKTRRQFCELIAEVGLRATLGLSDGDPVTVQMSRGMSR